MVDQKVAQLSQLESRWAGVGEAVVLAGMALLETERLLLLGDSGLIAGGGMGAGRGMSEGDLGMESLSGA
jgi:hypothetical protein